MSCPAQGSTCDPLLTPAAVQMMCPLSPPASWTGRKPSVLEQGPHQTLDSLPRRRCTDRRRRPGGGPGPLRRRRHELSGEPMPSRQATGREQRSRRRRRNLARRRRRVLRTSAGHPPTRWAAALTRGALLGESWRKEGDDPEWTCRSCAAEAAMLSMQRRRTDGFGVDIHHLYPYIQPAIGLRHFSFV